MMRTLEIVALVLVFMLHLVVLDRLLPGLHSLSAVAAAMLGGYVLADLLTGAAHWLGDNVGDESWPIVGPHFIRPFRHHHVDPDDITRHDFVETNGNNAILAIAPLVMLAWFAPAAPYLVTCLATTVLAFAATNQFHSWAHAETPPRIVRALQRTRLILPPKAHAHHHTAPYNHAYCVTSGWCNWIFDRTVSRMARR